MNCVRFSLSGHISQLEGNEVEESVYPLSAEGSRLRQGTWHGAVHISIQEFCCLTQVPVILEKLTEKLLHRRHLDAMLKVLVLKTLLQITRNS